MTVANHSPLSVGPLSRFVTESTFGCILSNFGTLTLEATRVENNSAPDGGGINNDGRLTLNTGAVVTTNTATNPTPSGGGINNLGTIVDNDTGNNVFGNDPDDCINASSGTGCPA